MKPRRTPALTSVRAWWVAPADMKLPNGDGRPVCGCGCGSPVPFYRGEALIEEACNGAAHALNRLHALESRLPAPAPPAGGREVVPQEVHDRGWQWRPVGDGAFAPPFGDIRVCIDCGCLVAGGPMRCARCANDVKPAPPAEAAPPTSDAWKCAESEAATLRAEVARLTKERDEATATLNVYGNASIVWLARLREAHLKLGTGGAQIESGRLMVGRVIEAMGEVRAATQGGPDGK